MKSGGGMKTTCDQDYRAHEDRDNEHPCENTAPLYSKRARNHQTHDDEIAADSSRKASFAKGCYHEYQNGDRDRQECEPKVTRPELSSLHSKGHSIGIVPIASHWP